MKPLLDCRTRARLNIRKSKRSTKIRARALASLIVMIGALLFSEVLLAAPRDVSQSGRSGSEPVAYWSFINGNTRDLSGNNNDGVGSGVTQASDRFGRPKYAYQFDGINDTIKITNSLSLRIGTSDYTIAAWIKTTDQTNNGRVFSKGSWNCTTGYMMRLNGDKLHLENSSGGSCLVNFDSNTKVTDGLWHFVVGVVDRDVGAAIYIDGVLDTTQKIDTSLADLSNGRNPTIGVADEQVQAPPEFFNGTIDDVSIFNVALSVKEVSELYNPGVNVYLPLILSGV